MALVSYKNASEPLGATSISAGSVSSMAMGYSFYAITALGDTSCIRLESPDSRSRRPL